MYISGSYAMILSKCTRLWLALVKDQWNKMTSNKNRRQSPGDEV
jgi:hypothetical protein